MSSASFEMLKAKLKSTGQLSTEDIESTTKAHGDLSDAELMTLESLELKLAKTARTQVTMDEYLQAMQILDSAAEGSPEYLQAEATVDAFERGG